MPLPMLCATLSPNLAVTAIASVIMRAISGFLGGPSATVAKRSNHDRTQSLAAARS